jgi:hypothetical protein
MLEFEWPGLLMAALVFSPQTVPRHANMALPFVAAAGGLLLSGRARRPALLVAGMAAVCVATFLRFWVDHADGPIEPWRAVGGLSWCLLVLGLVVMSEGVGFAERLRDLCASKGRVPA